ncbi:MAG: FadR family transcriptional regulator [Pararhodobacter sp.]|nr:FadR family transcriptional regulator [Pararhodobacter sp.]
MSGDRPMDPSVADTPGRPADRATTIAAFLRDSILSGHYLPGDRLPSEADLCAHFGVSRPTLREALGRLSANGLIRSRRGAGGGAFVARPAMTEAARQIAALVTLAGLRGRDPRAGDGADPAWPETLLAARIQLLMACARLAAMTGASIDPIRAEIDRQSDFSLSDEGFHASCRQMHLAVCAASGNPLMAMMGHALVEAHHSRLATGAVERRLRARFLSFHVRLANGIAGGRPDDTDAALTELWHFEYDCLPPRDDTDGAPLPERPPRMRDLRIAPVQRLGDPPPAKPTP